MSKKAKSISPDLRSLANIEALECVSSGHLNRTALSSLDFGIAQHPTILTSLHVIKVGLIKVFT